MHRITSISAYAGLIQRVLSHAKTEYFFCDITTLTRQKRDSLGFSQMRITLPTVEALRIYP